LNTLELLARLGYRRFKLVDQVSLAVVPPNGSFYHDEPPWRERLLRRLHLGGWRFWSFEPWAKAHRQEVFKRHGLELRDDWDWTGPWGGELEGQWMDHAAARQMYLRHRRDYYRRPNFKGFGYWVDWHATCD
jgi:hypothetical protein